MKITIFAATGGIGRHAVEQAVSAGHDVTAVARRPSGLPGAVRTVTADLRAADAATLQAAVHGADAVLSGLGPRTKADTGITSVGTAAIVAALTATGVRRFVIVSAAPIGTVPSPSRPAPPRHDPGDGFFMRHLLSHVARTMFRTGYTDLALMEDMLRDSELDWTVVRPPRLTDKPLTGRYRTAIDRNVRGGLTIARADVAHLMLDLVDRPESIRHTVGVAN